LENGFSFDKRICINEFWVNPHYYRKELLYDNSIKKEAFTSIYDLGHFHFMENCRADEVQRNI
jgi:hypothetical protein